MHAVDLFGAGIRGSRDSNHRTQASRKSLLKWAIVAMLAIMLASGASLLADSAQPTPDVAPTADGGTPAGGSDCNSNGQSDECDISCAATGCAGVPFCGTSNDCDADSVPDECDTFPTTILTSIRVATGLSSPLFCGAPEGDSRLFIVEQGGRIKILSGGSILATNYLNISGIITSGGERGLLGLAFDPNFSGNGHFYVNYTNLAGNTVIARYTATGGDPASNTADPASEVILKTITQDFSNHNGGCLQFGPDGFLYCGMGDGGSGNDPNNRAQDPNSLLGKILRLDVNNAPTYIPASNPYVGPGAPLDEIWAFGLRNPWRFSFDRARGDMYIGDVGQDTNEEISFEPAGLTVGRNFGWRCMEGTGCTGLSGCTCNSAALTLPILNLPQSTTGFCAVTGGYVYRGCDIRDLQGTYFYSDACANQIWSFRYTVAGGLTNHSNRTVELQPNLGSISTIVSFGEDGAGELYFVSLNGSVYKITGRPPVCGNNVVETGEECDDGNLNNGDGCNSSCDIEGPVCGNGNVEGLEECDDGNLIDGDGCSSMCIIEPPICGNGIVQSGEQCDDGNSNECDGCSFDCLMIPVPFPCVTDADCRTDLPNNACNRATCGGPCSTCIYTCIEYGDVDQPQDGNVTIDDILCVIEGFGTFASCPAGDISPCGGNATINLDDIIAEIDSFSGINPCGCDLGQSTPLCGSNQP